MKKILLALIVLVTTAAQSQECKPSTHVYVGGAIGVGAAVDKTGFVVAINAGIATTVLGIDISANTFPHPSAPSVFAINITKPFFINDTKVTFGAGYAYVLLTNDNKALNSFKPTGYIELTKLLTYDGAAISFRGNIARDYFSATIGMTGIFKKN